MRRWEYIALARSAAGRPFPFPLGAQHFAMPVIGILSSGSGESDKSRLTAFREGLTASGYTARNNRVPFCGRLLRSPSVIRDRSRGSQGGCVETGVPATTAVKAATTKNLLFFTGNDPVRLALVASLNRPGGNITVS